MDAIDNTNKRLFVAIDVGKTMNCFAVYRGLEFVEIVPPTEARNNRSGYQMFYEILENALQEHLDSRVRIGMEPTGIYHEAWAYAIQENFSRRAELHFLNPYQVKQKRLELHNGRKRKNDPIDVWAIASCLRDRMGYIACLKRKDEMRLELWATAYKQAELDQSRLAANLLNQIDRLWPGAVINARAFRKAHPNLLIPESMVLTKPLERKLIRTILSHMPNPYQWMGKSIDQIQAELKSFKYHCDARAARRVFQVLNNALLPPVDIAELLAARLQEDYQRYLILETRVKDLKQQTEAIVPGTPAAVLTTFPGINNFLAARYLAYIVNPLRFHRADEIWAFAGYDVTFEDSGDHRQTGKISKRGEPGLRDALFQIGLFTSQSCASIQKARQRALDNGKGRIGAILHAAHKANRICYRLLIDQKPYDPRLSQ